MESYFFSLTFGVLTLVTIVSAGLVVTLHNLARGVVCLIFFFLGLAGLYFLLEAQFLALVEVMIYAGAVGVLFAFVVMLSPYLREIKTKQSLNQGWGLLLSVLFLISILVAFRRLPGPAAAPAAGEKVPLAELGRVLLGEYLLPFELLSLVLLVALVGAVVLGVRGPGRGSDRGAQ